MSVRAPSTDRVQLQNGLPVRACEGFSGPIVPRAPRSSRKHLFCRVTRHKRITPVSLTDLLIHENSCTRCRASLKDALPYRRNVIRLFPSPPCFDCLALNETGSSLGHAEVVREGLFLAPVVES